MIPIVNPLRNPVRRARQAKDVPQYFTRNSIAYTSDGEQVAANVVRRERGKFGKAVLIEEGTANLLSSAYSHGFTSAVNVTVVNGGTYTVSMTGSGSIVLSGAGTGTVTATAPITITASGTTLTLTPTGDTGRVQVEAKAYATTWQIGGMARSPEILIVPTDGVLNPQEGTIEFWVKAQDLYIKRRDILEVNTADGSDDRVVFGYNVTLSGLELYWRPRYKRAYAINIPEINPLTEWVHLGFRYQWNGVGYDLAIIYNGQIIKTGVSSNGQMTNFYQAIIGGTSPSIDNILHDDFRISNIARSDAEIAEAYKSGMPLLADDWTTAIL